jgi:hypothetical protein
VIAERIPPRIVLDEHQHAAPLVERLLQRTKRLVALTREQLLHGQ